MKWYSVKKYIPPTGCDLFIRIEKNKDQQNLYDRYLIASLQCLYFDDLSNLSYWELHGVPFDTHLEKFYVSHFCIPEPVEF